MIVEKWATKTNMVTAFTSDAEPDQTAPYHSNNESRSDLIDKKILHRITVWNVSPEFPQRAKTINDFM